MSIAVAARKYQEESLANLKPPKKSPTRPNLKASVDASDNERGNDSGKFSLPLFSFSNLLRITRPCS